jgi:arylsulfatase A-like enzyme
MAERYEEELLSSRFKPGTANGEGPLLIPWGRYRVYRVGKYKLAKHFEKGKYSTHLFDLKKDPEEMTDLAANPDKASVLQQVEQELKNWEIVLGLPALDGKRSGAGGAGKNNKLSDEAKEQLKALGYMGD